MALVALDRICFEGLDRPDLQELRGCEPSARGGCPRTEDRRQARRVITVISSASERGQGGLPGWQWVPVGGWHADPVVGCPGGPAGRPGHPVAHTPVRRATVRARLWARANQRRIARTFKRPRTLNCCRPRFRASALTHSAVAARRR